MSISALLIGYAFDFKTPFYRYSPERFETAITQFEQNDAQLADLQPDGIMFYGSSSIRGLQTPIAQSFPSLNIIVRGFGGSMMHDLLFYFDRVVLPHEPKILFIYAGENDVSAHVWQHTILDRLTQIIGKVKTHLPNTQVYFISIKPTPYRWSLNNEQKKVNLLVQSLAEQSDQFNFIDIDPIMLNQANQPEPSLFQADGIHMSPAGYQRWINLIKPILIPKKSEP